MKIFYKCYGDGKECDKATPRVENGIIFKESNEVIKEKFNGVINKDVLEYSWDICMDCPRNCSFDGFCHGGIEVER